MIALDAESGHTKASASYLGCLPFRPNNDFLADRNTLSSDAIHCVRSAPVQISLCLFRFTHIHTCWLSDGSETPRRSLACGPTELTDSPALGNDNSRVTLSLSGIISIRFRTPSAPNCTDQSDDSETARHCRRVRLGPASTLLRNTFVNVPVREMKTALQ